MEKRIRQGRGKGEEAKGERQEARIMAMSSASFLSHSPRVTSFFLITGHC